MALRYCCCKINIYEKNNYSSKPWRKRWVYGASYLKVPNCIFRSNRIIQGLHCSFICWLRRLTLAIMQMSNFSYKIHRNIARFSSDIPFCTFCPIVHETKSCYTSDFSITLTFLHTNPMINFRKFTISWWRNRVTEIFTSLSWICIGSTHSFKCCTKMHWHRRG